MEKYKKLGNIAMILSGGAYALSLVCYIARVIFWNQGINLLEVLAFLVTAGLIVTLFMGKPGKWNTLAVCVLAVVELFLLMQTTVRFIGFGSFFRTVVPQAFVFLTYGTMAVVSFGSWQEGKFNKVVNFSFVPVLLYLVNILMYIVYLFFTLISIDRLGDMFTNSHYLSLMVWNLIEFAGVALFALSLKLFNIKEKKTDEEAKEE